MGRKKKDSKTTSYVVGGIIIFIMVSSGFGIMLGGFADNAKKLEYNDLTFTPMQQGYRVEIDDRVLDFSYYPEQLEGITLDPSISERLKVAAEIDFTYDFSSEAAQEMALAGFLIQENYLKGIKFIRQGATGENEFNTPIITCRDATPNVPVVEWRLGNETRFTVVGDCIIAEAERASDIIVLSDRMVYSILNVMD